VPLFADVENDVIFEIAEALRVPVLILTVLALAVVLVELGGFFVELSRRRRRDITRLRSVAESTRRVLVEGGGAERARRELATVAWSVSMGRTLARLVDDWGKPDAESMMSKALVEHDFVSLRRLERTRILVRAGPALGLMGTLIPLSPALAGLAAGDVQELSENLRVAFSVTVIGLLIGAIAFGISLVRDRLYSQDLSDLEFVANRLTSTGPLLEAPAQMEKKAQPEAEKKPAAEEGEKKESEPEQKPEEQPAAAAAAPGNPGAETGKEASSP
jgi:biopolymer transport protein ExbB/TolQ